MFGFKFNAKRHFQKLHPDDEYDGSKITNIKFRCYGCQWGFDTYGSLETHFAQNHPEQSLNPEKVYLGDTQTTAATFQSVKRMKTPTKRKRQPDSNSRPSSAPGIQGHPAIPSPRCQYCGLQFPNEMALSSHIMMAHPDSPAMSSYQGDLVCNSCEFRCDNPQSLALHQQTHQVQTPAFRNDQYPGIKEDHSQQQPYMNYPTQHHAPPQQTPMNDPYMEFKAEEEQLNQQYQHHMYQNQPPYHQPYDQNYHQDPHYHQYPPPPQQSHHMGYDQNHQYHHQQYQQQQPPPSSEHHYMHPSSHSQGQLQENHHNSSSQGHHPQQIMSPPPYHQQQQPMHPSSHATPPPHHHQVPPEQQHYQQHAPHPQMMPNPSYTDHHLQDVNKVPPEEKLVNEALMNDQNGNMNSYHQYHENYSHLPNNQSSPRQNGGGGSSSSKGTKQRRVNIGKMFQTHICYVCDARLAKLDCIKMHFKNRHPETNMDLNKVMISRVVCYHCGVRKKEYAILNRHFQVEHKGHDIDPFRIGMDAPSPFNLSPEEEADLVKLPIPEPVKQDDSKRVKTFMERVDRAAEVNDKSMDSMDEPSNSVHEMSFEKDEESSNNHHVLESTKLDPTKTEPTKFVINYEDNDSSIPRKKRRQPRGFKNNKCLMCGKTFSRITTLKKHFSEQHPDVAYDKSKIEITQLPCYMCEAKFTDSRHAIRHFETTHPGIEFDPCKIHVPGIEITANGANDDDHEESMQQLSKLDDEEEFMSQHKDPKSNVEEFSKKSTTEDAKKVGFRCYLCNYWCSTLTDFQVHFAPETRAHEHVLSHSIMCPLCKEEVDTTDDMFDHVTKKHSNTDSLNNKTTNCVESC